MINELHSEEWHFETTKLAISQKVWWKAVKNALRFRRSGLIGSKNQCLTGKIKIERIF